MKKLTESQVKNIKEKLMKFQNELIRKNRIKKDNDIYNAWYYGGITYNGIKHIRYLFNEYEDKDVKDIRYLFNEDEDNAVDEDRITYKESPFKSIIADIRNKLSKNGNRMIKKGLYYVEKMKQLPESFKFKNELIRKNKINNRIKKDLSNYNSVKDIRYLFSEYEYEDEDIRYFFNVNEDEDKITYKESPFKLIIVDIRNKLLKNGDKLLRKGLYCVEEIKT